MKKAEHQPMPYKIRADDLIALNDRLIGKSIPEQGNEQLFEFISTFRSIDGTGLKEDDQHFLVLLQMYYLP